MEVRKRSSEDLVALGKWLRKQTAKCRTDQGSVQEIRSRLSELHPEDAALVVQDGNQNGKGALHFVSQIRGGDADAPELIQLLVSLRADLDASILRGHTALIFACSRGHSSVAELLLDLGASPLVVTVCGETAAKLGRGRVAPEVQVRLDAAEKAASPSAWRDFQNVPVAQDAEELWMENAAKRDAAKIIAAKERLAQDAAEKRFGPELMAAFREAIGAQESDSFFKVVVIAMAEGRIVRETLSRLLGSAVGEVLRNAGRLQLPIVFTLFREQDLELALRGMSHRDRRPLCAVLRALIEQIRSPENSGAEFHCMPINDIIESAELLMAVELLLVRPNLSEADREPLERLLCQFAEEWTEGLRFSEVLSLSSHMLLEEHSLVEFLAGPADAGLRLGRASKKHILAVAEWLHILRFASRVRSATALWPKLVRMVAAAAVSKKLPELLLRATTMDSIKLDVEVVQALSVSLVDAGKETARIARVSGPDFEHEDMTQAPLYKLEQLAEWVEGEAQVSATLHALKDMAAAYTAEQPLLVGVDTEWGRTATSESSIAVLQIAACRRVWVVDCLQLNTALSSLVEWLRDSDAIRILGFAFSHDSEKLAELLPCPNGSAGNFIAKVVDIQELALRHLRFGKVPGLKAVCETWLGKTLDKSYQCSDWSRRPLLDAQLQYAAADAAVLLDLSRAMGVEHHSACVGDKMFAGG